MPELSGQIELSCGQHARLATSKKSQVCSFFLLMFALSPVASQAADAANSGCINNLTVRSALSASYQVPCDYNGAPSREGIYRFAWNTFLAMSWPALPEKADGSNRGKPDTTARYGAAGATPVWDTWRGKRELFRPTTSMAWDSTSPGQFNAFPATADPNPNVKACTGLGVQDKASLGTMQVNKVDNYVDETDEIGLAVLWSAIDPISGKPSKYPTENSILRYQVKFNEDHWNYVVNKGIYATTNLKKLIADTTTSKLGGVNFPAGNNNTSVTGSILTKSAWKMISATEAEKGKYYTVDAYYYVPTKTDSTEVCYTPAKFALIAIHVIRKTAYFPFFFFSTFEHKGNYPGIFNYANTNMPSSKPSSKPSSILPSGYEIPYVNPAKPVVNIPANQSAYQANRLVPVTKELTKVNREADIVNDTSVWSNYQLVGAQYLPVNGLTGRVDPDANQDFFLANPVIETNQRFQYFDGGFATSGTNNVATAPATSTAATVNMGGCMGCHGNAQLSNTEFSFTLGNITKPLDSTTAAETLADKCKEIGLGMSADGLNCIVK
jgi:hypothetical protein